jgi:hypothetical protein
MILKLLGGGHTTISDNSETAQKIRQGYDYEIENSGQIKIKNKTRFDLTAFVKKLKNKSADFADIQEYLLSEIQEKDNFFKSI